MLTQAPLWRSKTMHNAESAAPTGSNRLRFDRYVLDLDRGCLLLDGNEIALRPKTFAILRHLIENPGRLVSKDELFAAVWPNLAISDDVLVQSIGELRRAFSDDGPRLIRTVPRRGYRFESDVSDASAVITPGLPSNDTTPRAHTISVTDVPPAPVTRSPTGLFVGLAIVALIVTGVAFSVGTDWLSTESQRPGSRSPATTIGAKPTVAVLPLVDQSDDRAREYFADGLTQDIINALGRFSSLTVMSWNAVFPYKEKPASPEVLRQRLAVRYLIEGSVRRSGERVRVNAQLVDTSNGQVLWSSRFDEALVDVFALQNTIIGEIVGALATRITQLEQRRVLTKPTESLEAYDYVLRARPALLRPTRANTVEARTLLRRAIDLDANYAAAYAALAETYFIAVSLGWAESPALFLNRAEELSAKALSLDASDVRARVILGRLHIFHQRYKQAETEIERAIATNPNDAQALAGRGNILMWLGQTDAAVTALELAQRIDPDLNPFDRFALSLAYYLQRRYDAAVELAELNLRETAGANASRILLAVELAQQKRAADAARVVAEIRRTDPTFDPREFGTKFLNAADL